MSALWYETVGPGERLTQGDSIFDVTAVEKAGNEPVRVEGPETHTAYLIVREDVYRRMCELTAMDHSGRSLYEFGEFHPDT
jgi:hypothetical protein